MTETRAYQCDICKSVYQTEVEATACERKPLPNTPNLPEGELVVVRHYGYGDRVVEFVKFKITEDHNAVAVVLEIDQDDPVRHRWEQSFEPLDRIKGVVRPLEFNSR